MKNTTLTVIFVFSLIAFALQAQADGLNNEHIDSSSMQIEDSVSDGQSYDLIDLSAPDRYDFYRVTDRDTEADTTAGNSPEKTCHPDSQNSTRQFHNQRKGKALMDAILHLYIASVRLTEVGETEKGRILLRQAQDLGIYAQREFQIQIPVELRERLGLMSKKEYQLQQEKIRLEREVNQLHQRLNHIDQQLRGGNGK